MIETQAFLVMFAVQILAMSVLHPIWAIRFARAKAAEFPVDRFHQMYPGVDHVRFFERRLLTYRVLNAIIVAIGVMLWIWLYDHTRRADWDDGPVELATLVYSMSQFIPLMYVSWLSIRHVKLLRTLGDGKRTAVLKRRGLFDFVSPFVVVLAGLCYFLYVAYVFYIARHPFPGFAGPFVNIFFVSLILGAQVFVIYKLLYGRKTPNESHESRMHAIEFGVKACVYISILIPVSLSLNFTLKMFDLPRWEPVAGSAHYVLFAILVTLMSFTLPRRNPHA